MRPQLAVDGTGGSGAADAVLGLDRFTVSGRVTASEDPTGLILPGAHVRIRLKPQEVGFRV
jgi:hypothetical protein